MTVTIGQAVPDCSLPATSDKTISLSDLQGQRVVLYFYPKDATPGCTLESQQFRDLHAEFAAANTVIFGISRDSIKSHEKFKTAQALPFELLSDSDEALCTLFDVIKLKNMYGKQVRGIERSTFLIDENGVLRQEWRKLKADGHASIVLAAVAALG
ncbi:peroxiredoxin Q/BCP [Paraperlucidibaca baekdonensis]|uniref:thioredoxin-dependent peroxiredoxin n=1 Tax=Paraperlucidibaca baekdonensis TaxID=748120 RepID=A0A3E0H1K4_9GAMM|nr:peroxiredoxin [Paraperlucidibaca baekdonensis]REH36770.1 peroxiredoxin Q/BCP [Paraperlucidibaca baekdonensis]